MHLHILSNRLTCSSAMQEFYKLLLSYQQRQRGRVMKFMLHIFCSYYYFIIYLLTTYTYLFPNSLIRVPCCLLQHRHCHVVLFSSLLFYVVTVSYCCILVTSTMYCCVISISVIHFHKFFRALGTYPITLVCMLQ